MKNLHFNCREHSLQRQISGFVAGKVFRDPVHGDVHVPDFLVDIIDTPEFQRLRGVKALGTAYLVYPGAVHTRFEHSLGTYWLTRRLLDIIQEAQGLVVDDDVYRIVLASALLHDVTHIPFGHTFEDERKVFDRHDKPERFNSYLPRGSLGKVLRRLGLLDEVVAVLSGKVGIAWHQEIFAGTVCADLLDYLGRDAYFCGLRHRYDPRIFRAFRVEPEGNVYLEACKEGMIRSDVLSEVVNLLRLRYFLSERVYFHHTKTASGAMISRAVEEAVEEGLTLGDLQQMTDEMLLYCLEDRYGSNETISRLLRCIRSRSLYKKVYVVTRKVGEERRRRFVNLYHENSHLRREVEDDLIRRLKLKPGELIVYCPAFDMQLKEAAGLVRVSSGTLKDLSELGLPEIKVLQELHRNLWRFYVFICPDRMKRAHRIAEICEDTFQEPNHLPMLRSGQLYLNL